VERAWRQRYSSTDAPGRRVAEALLGNSQPVLWRGQLATARARDLPRTDFSREVYEAIDHANPQGAGINRDGICNGAAAFFVLVTATSAQAALFLIFEGRGFTAPQSTEANTGGIGAPGERMWPERADRGCTSCVRRCDGRPVAREPPAYPGDRQRRVSAPRNEMSLKVLAPTDGESYLWSTRSSKRKR
jgi:hypothetical protein